MSIGGEIKARVWERRGVEFRPRPPISVYRPVYLVPDVNDRICGPFPDEAEAVEMEYVRADLENFVGNGRVVVAFGPKPAAANFRRLTVKKGKRPKTWSMRTMQPKPGYRLFGLFAATDVFLGTHLTPRDLVDFDEDMGLALEAWASLFGSYDPVVSENANDYISQGVVRL